jgi:hypothetical protein
MEHGITPEITVAVVLVKDYYDSFVVCGHMNSACKPDATVII